MHCRCLRCGSYRITGTARAIIHSKLTSESERLNLSSHLFENQGVLITSANLQSMIPSSRPPVSRQAERLLREIAKRYPAPGQYFEVLFNDVESLIENLKNPQVDEWKETDSQILESAGRYLPLLAASWAQSEREFNFLLAGVLTVSRKLLGTNKFEYVITADGWDFIEGSKPRNESTEAFVAMSFAPALDPIFQDLIRPAVEDCGFVAIRVDRTEHVNRIDDEIISRIRQARFLIADFTHHKNGVYFEAGFALGLVIPVIWMCREEDLQNSHFDTRQYNAVVWTEDDLADARARLAIRIGAVVGHSKQREAGHRN